MTYNFLTVEPLSAEVVAAVLAQCLDVSVQDVDVADEDTDQELRNWDALVFCDEVTVLGDVSTSLDIYVQESVQPQPSERDLASAFASAADTVVLFPAEEAPPSAYWLATEAGLVTRARLYGSDDEPRYTIDRVEAPVGRLPHVTVARIPEVVRELKIATPLTDAFAAHLRRMHPDEAGTLGSPAWTASDRLGAWEKLVRHMEAGWAPSGWFPPDLYCERLEVRDELEQVCTQLPKDATVLLRNSLGSLDALFAELTVDDTGGLLRKELLPACAASPHGWWWNRRPEPLPW
ncbi:hypothetical protein ACGFZB_06370 [Streptomyces cinerochromogenes]|uniref:Uncharacterized protein n=1 Tax=Streptomyces cinerochromogenes TaxID=66422 RepID=A0ABW7B2X4_9ACTN